MSQAIGIPHPVEASEVVPFSNRKIIAGNTIPETPTIIGKVAFLSTELAGNHFAFKSSRARNKKRNKSVIDQCVYQIKNVLQLVLRDLDFHNLIPSDQGN